MRRPRLLTDREQERSAPDGQHPFGKDSLPAQFTPEEMAEHERYADRRYEDEDAGRNRTDNQRGWSWGVVMPPPNGAA